MGMMIEGRWSARDRTIERGAFVRAARAALERVSGAREDGATEERA